MKELITDIMEVDNVNLKDDAESWESYDGYYIKTTKQEIKLLISNGQSCCENFGYFWCTDDTKEFIGAELLSIDIVNECMEKRKLPEYNHDETQAVFVNLETDKGTLQFTAYNQHNGYYGHTVVIKCDKFTHEASI